MLRTILCTHVHNGEGNGNPLQYSCLENHMDWRAWWAAVHGVTKSQIQLNDFTFTFHFHALEKEMATHSSVLAWRIPGTAKPGGLPSMRSHRVGHDWSDLAAAAAVTSLFKIIQITGFTLQLLLHSLDRNKRRKGPALLYIHCNSGFCLLYLET